MELTKCCITNHPQCGGLKQPSCDCYLRGLEVEWAQLLFLALISVIQGGAGLKLSECSLAECDARAGKTQTVRAAWASLSQVALDLVSPAW